MSVASAEVYLCKVDNSSGLNFDWEKREYYKTHFINSEYLIKQQLNHRQSCLLHKEL